MPPIFYPPDCTRCNGDYYLSNPRDMSNPAPVCEDPDCPDSVCDECSDHEECCEECVQVGNVCEDCPPGQECCGACTEDVCGTLDLVNCTGPHCDYHKDYICNDSCFELFGDQTAEWFHDGCLPQLPMDHGAGEKSHTQYQDLLNWDPISTPGQPLIPVPQIYKDHCDGFQHSASLLMQAAAVGNVCHSHSQDSPSSGSQSTASETICAHKGVPSHKIRCTAARRSLSKSPTERYISCQWTSATGEPCGEILAVGDDLHEHLKKAHCIKTETFCRWLGCPESNHRYANSVQRHTWGHSGYRPYKCPECSEGFAAAAVRDEHVANIHRNMKTFTCDQCPHQCTSATNLKRHKDEKHRSERFQCEYCNKHGKRTLFPRGPNLARHFRKCKFVLAEFSDADGAHDGKISDEWFPPGYRRGHHGMNKAKVTPPKYLPVP